MAKAKVERGLKKSKGIVRPKYHNILQQMASLANDDNTKRETNIKEPEPTVINDEVKGLVLSEAKAMNNMEGKDKKGDKIFTGDSAGALDAFKEMLPTPKEGDFSYELRGVHLGKSIAKGKTKDDVYKAFLFWSQKDEDVTANRFNVSKALRRFETFAKTQEKHYSETGWFKDPVYFRNMDNVREAFPIDVSKDPLTGTPKEKSLDGCLFWGIDLSKVKSFDLEKLGVTPVELARWMWYLLLASVFDKVSQHPGVVLCENIGYMGLGDMMSFSSALKPVEKDLNQLFYGCMPLKMKKIIIVNSPWWINILLGIMRLFMSRKMSSRIKNDTMEKMYSRVGGKKSLPKGCMGGEGSEEGRYDQGINEFANEINELEKSNKKDDNDIGDKKKPADTL